MEQKLNFHFVEVTPGVKRVLEDLHGGEKIHITKGQEVQYSMTDGARKHRSDVLAAAFEILEREGLLKELEPGLFDGCGQVYIVVR